MTLQEISSLLAQHGYAVSRSKDQASSQEFEWNYCANDLRDATAVREYLKRRAERDVRSSFLFTEFCAGDPLLLDELMQHTAGRTVLEIGSSWCPQVPLLPARRHLCIEPMAEKIDDLAQTLYGERIFDGMRTWPRYGDRFIPELVNFVDGLVYVRNCIDHSPAWPLILSNIASYARAGCRLMIWNDIDHFETAAIDPGHYNICSSPEAFVRLIENLGFAVQRRFDFHDREKTNVGLVAVKTRDAAHGTPHRFRISEQGARQVMVATD